MVKRAKLTLDLNETKDRIKNEDISESVSTEQPDAPDKQKSIGKLLFVAGLAIASMIIFRQRIF